MSSIKNIAIVGAGGQIGKIITSAILAQGKHNLTAITRPDSTSTMPSGLHAVKKADYTSHESLVAAMQGQDALIITMNVLAPRDSQTKLIDAAADAGVKWIMPNEYGADLRDSQMGKDNFLGAPQQAVRDYIENKEGVNWVSVACSFWYEFSLGGTEIRYGFDFKEKTLTLFDKGDVKITTSTWPQVGRAVAKIFALPDEAEGDALSLSKTKNRAVHISSFCVSQLDMLASVLRVTGDKESDWTITQEDSHDRYKRAVKMFQEGNFMGFGMLLYARAFYPEDPADGSKKLQNEALGLPEEDFDDFTRIGVDMGMRASSWSAHV
ncbi:Hypothetical protein R9X50_00284100 [Acrodontium crateriforme]|uniref:NmrA-like domain-containing protein n=1 Tax=Acrodontium crateriforme TaxID=150365 RepID=A0AAQ3M2A4_9PEZI|nr:Hypothetical protein R9X50_00284100 [Acrodontium crateriforme]